MAKTPADGHLAPGDAITAVDSTPTPTSEALVAATRAHRPGDIVRLTVQSPKGTRTETVKLALAPPSQGPPHAFMGIATSTQYKPVQLPFPVTIDPGNIGGPSAGLAFTLGIIDELGTGDLTGGRLIAATGTIEPDGSVGDVGGVTQKTAAVRNAGAVAFLVPPGEYNDAVKHAGPHLKVIKVTSLDRRPERPAQPRWRPERARPPAGRGRLAGRAEGLDPGDRRRRPARGSTIGPGGPPAPGRRSA